MIESKHQTVVIELFGGPGAGKSTLERAALRDLLPLRLALRIVPRDLLQRAGRDPTVPSPDERILHPSDLTDGPFCVR